MRKKTKNQVTTSMQTIFKKRFIQFVVIPILTLFVVGVGIFIYKAKIDQKTHMEIMLTNLRTSLEQEVELGATAFGKFLLLNNREVLNQLEDYNNEDNIQNYEYYKSLEENFNVLISPDANIDGTHFYFKNGTEYSHRTHILFSLETIKNKAWYKQVKKKPNLIAVGMEDARGYIPNVNKKNQKELIFAISPEYNDKGSNLDVGIMFKECMTIDVIKNLIGTEYIAYIVNNDGKIVYQSEDEYIDEQGQFIMKDNKNILWKSAFIDRTQLKLFLVMKEPYTFMGYSPMVVLIFIITILIFGVFYIFARGFFKSIVQPVSELSNEMRNVTLEPITIKVEETAPYEIQNIQDGFNRMTDRIQKLVEENQEKEYAKHVEELKALQLQINPHFLSNTLNTIKFMAQVSKHEGIRQMTEYLMKIMDCTFRNHDGVHSLKEEVSMLEAYIYIMKIRYAESFTVYINLDKACEHIEIPKLLLQPFVENAICHGMEEDVENGEIHIDILLDEGIKITIEDNGKGISEEMQKRISNGYENKSGRIGINNVIRRLNLFYGDKVHFEISSEVKKGTKVMIDIPMEDNAECML